ncbi:TetR/AcrR family transcriptional regulator [Paraburkholderia sp. 22B1P]|jgi:AcrR family transcriptional regulator|uniref:TetR/AcrR family transcriptional regulator n=1 Tax=Paraburkholderia sp. 22B1P TaxID=3080498 RepID=UPI0020847DC5|nr:TetR/AcrR family transcriptional regulator [Paraburkholderia sp. 22B1P]GJH37634.1 TetR family transcriptional regulator [Paraburkholderia hospita]
MKNLSKKGAATRQAILESARKAFTQSGYDVGVREIAENAGVTAMLVNRYFGSKDQLFEDVIDLVLSAPGILTRQTMTKAPDVPTLCQEIAAALVARTASDVTPMDGFLIMLRSSNNEQAMGILRGKFETHFARPLTQMLPGEEASQRAAMFLAVIAGFQVMRQIVEIAGLTQVPPDQLVQQLEAIFELLVKGRSVVVPK